MTARPIRVRLSRAKGWRLPANTVSVARPTRWGNPWRIRQSGTGSFWWVEGPRENTECETAVEALELSLRKFRYYAESRLELLAPLRGKSLACWCTLDAPCHAAALQELANR